MDKPTAPTRFLDESAARVEPALIESDGFCLLMRYINPDSGGFNSAKLVREAELEYDYARGVAVALVYQNTGADGLGGSDAGHTHGRIAHQLLAGLDWHGSHLLVAALDTHNPSAAEIPTVDAFMAGFQAEVEPVCAPYSPYVYTEHWGATHGRVCWQSAAFAGNGAGSGGTSWDGRHLSQWAAAYQRVQQFYSGAVDVNDLFIDPADFGFYHPSWEDDMALSDDDVSKVAKATVGQLLEVIKVDANGVPVYPEGNEFRAAIASAVGAVTKAGQDGPTQDAIVKAVADELARRLAT